MRSAFSRPFSGFSVEYSVYASIWIIFMVPMVWVFLADQSQPHKTLSLGTIAIFILFYGFTFGAISYYPRGWSQRRKLVAYFAILAGIASASTICLGVGAIMFVPYLCAYLAYLCPRQSWSMLMAVLAGGIALLTHSEEWISILITTVLVPIFINSMALLSKWSDSKNALKDNLRITQERESIATDVHDLLGHSLTVINLKAELARRLIDTDPERAKAEIESIASLSRESLAEVRSTVTRMRTPSFAGEVAAARRALETVGISADLPDNPEIAGTNQALFAWTLRELVTNIVRHSRATHCTVRVSNQKLQVSDNGIGFEAPASTTASGLTGVQQRVEEAGGNIVYREPSTILLTMNGNDDPL